MANGGVPFDPPKVEVPKKEPSAPVEKGPSKKCKECSFDLFIYLHFLNFEQIPLYPCTYLFYLYLMLYNNVLTSSSIFFHLFRFFYSNSPIESG